MRLCRCKYQQRTVNVNIYLQLYYRFINHFFVNAFMCTLFNTYWRHLMPFYQRFVAEKRYFEAKNIKRRFQKLLSTSAILTL